jgi:hypothetical protein
MHKITIVLLVYLLCVNGIIAGGLSNLQISPIQPSTSDSVVLSYKYDSQKNPAKIFTHQIDIANFSIYLNTCFGEGEQTAGDVFFDTVNLGIYSIPGLYHITLYMNKTLLSDTLCSHSIWYDSAEITFSVSGPNGIVPAANDGNLAFSLYPNPANDKLNCVINKPTQNTTLQLFTTAGRAAAPAMPVTQANTEIDVSTLPAGLYFLQLQDDKQRVVKKFVKY